MFAQSDDEVFHVELGKQHVCRAEKFIVEVFRLRVTVDAGGQGKFLEIGFNKKGVGIFCIILPFGIDQNLFVETSGEPYDAAAVFRTENAFQVVGEKNDVRLTHQLFKLMSHVRFVKEIDGKSFFRIDADDMIVSGDDACLLNGRDVVGRKHQRMMCHAAEGIEDKMTGFIIADGAYGIHATAESGAVGDDVSCSSEHFFFTASVENGNRCFGRDPVDAAIDEMVEHHVTDAENIDLRKQIDTGR